MLYVRGLDTGYRAYTPYGDEVLESRDHQALFDFVETGLSNFKKAFIAYFSSRIDGRTGACIGEGMASPLAGKLRKSAQAVHPLLANDSYLDGLSSMLTDHLNIVLLHHGIDLTKDEYLHAAKHLGDPIFHGESARGRVRPRSELLEKQYRIYEEKDTKALIGGYVHLERIQEQVRLWLYWILDASSARFGKLTIDERARLYRQVFNINDITADLSFTERFSWSMPHREVLSIETYAEKPEDILQWRQGAEEKKEYAQAFKALDDDSVEIDADLHAYLQNQISKAQESSIAALFSEYEVDNFAHLLALEVRLMVGESPTVKRCRHCTRYFLAEKSTIEYCTRIAKGEKESCDVIGPKQSFSRLLSEDAALKAYNATYKTYYARQRRGTMTEMEFSSWRDEAKRRLQDVREGRFPLEEYISWLKQDVRKWTTN